MTELGERLVERSEDLLRHVRDLEEEVALWKDIGTGEVTVGVDPEAELSLLPKVLEAFVPVYPRVQVSVRSGQHEALLTALLRGEVHFVVADAELASERDDLEVLRLAADPLAAAVRPDHPLSRKRNIVPSDIEAHPVAGASTAPRFERWSAESARREGRTQPYAASLVCDNYEVLVRLAECSDTIVFGPKSLLVAYERAGRLKVMSWPLEGPDSGPGLIRSKGRHLSPAAERPMALFES